MCILLLGEGTSASRALGKIENITNTQWTRLIITFEIDETMMDNLEDNNLRTRFECTTANTSGTYQYWCAPQLELGSIATTYAPAPEDSYLKTEVETIIEQTANSITSSVNEQLTLYATLEHLSDMEDKIINEEVVDLLKSYVTTTDLENNLSGYTTSDELDTALEAYVTSAEMSTTVEQTQESIISEVNTTLAGYVTTINLDNTLSSYSTTLQMNTAIDQTQTSILNTVSSIYTTITDTETLSKTIEASLELKLNTTDLISEINASADVITLTSNRLSITSDHFTLTEAGEITATSGTVGGFTLGSTSFSSNFSGIYNYTNWDLLLACYSCMDICTLDGVLTDILDANEDGSVDSSDFLYIKRVILGTSTNSKTISGTLTINTQDPKNNISVEKDGTQVVSIGAGGINTNFLISDIICCGYSGGTTDSSYGIVLDSQQSAIKIVNGGSTAVRFDNTELYSTVPINCTAEQSCFRSIELSFSTPYIDFHRNYSSDDYTSRIIELSSGVLTVYNSITSASDKRLKNNIENIDNKYMELFDNLEVKTYNFNNSNDLDCGFIAQDVLELEESLGIEKSILVRNTGEEREINGKTQIDYYSLNYNNLTAMCVKKIQELEKRIEELEGK